MRLRKVCFVAENRYIKDITTLQSTVNFILVEKKEDWTIFYESVVLIERSESAMMDNNRIESLASPADLSRAFSHACSRLGCTWHTNTFASRPSLSHPISRCNNVIRCTASSRRVLMSPLFARAEVASSRGTSALDGWRKCR